MKEKREYSQYFAEEPRKLRPQDNLYWLKVEFDYLTQSGVITILDPGGMMDMLAQSPKQEAWVVKALEGLAAERTWTTAWVLSEEQAYDAFIELLEAHSDSTLKKKIAQ